MSDNIISTNTQLNLSDRVGRSRIRSVDSMRGVAMILVIMQHAYHLIDQNQVGAVSDQLIYGITRMASVAFMSISGMMIGYFIFTRPDWRQVHRRFIRRAILLILVVHILIPLARFFYYTEDRFQHLLHAIIYEYQITDIIALSLIVAPVILVKLRPYARLVLILLLLLITPVISAYLQPSSSFLIGLKVLMFGTVGTESRLLVTWPFAPWLAIFLSGSIVGKMISEIRDGNLDEAKAIGRMRRMAALLAVVGIALTIGYKVLKMHFGGDISPRLFEAIYPSRTTSLLPIYSAILLMIFSFLMVHIDIKNRYDRFAWFASVFGRTSLFSYVTQFAIVQSIPALLGMKQHIGLRQYAALFVAGTFVTWVLSYTYGRRRRWIAVNDYQIIANKLPA